MGVRVIIISLVVFCLGAGSHFDISTSKNISIRKIRKICVNRGYTSISVSKHKHKKMEKVPFLMLILMLMPM